jgi:UDP-N-acetylmuramoyl-tripeptide--D-alanyl-D-alanine ligase
MTAMPLWTVDAMVAAMGAAPAGAPPADVSGISIDTRTIGAGDAFFAIKGDHRDGHEFVEAALAAGAGLAVVAADRRDAFPNEAPLLVVADVLEALRALGRAARARSGAKFAGVTGSVGKTGTKEALRAVLAAQAHTHASAASYNNHWGVPLSLARCPLSARYAVLEMGMNHAGEIAPLTRLVRPHVAIITTIEPVHLEFFDSVEAIADAKAEIFLGLERGGAAVLNRDNPHFARLERSARNAGVDRIVGCGEHAGADARLITCEPRPDGSAVRARILGTEVDYRMGVPGRHHVLNSLAVLATVSLMGADLAAAAHALGDLAPGSGRGARVRLVLADGEALLIDESYNANPASMRAALALLGESGASGRRIAVLGDMLELGPRGADFHRALAEAVLVNAVDLVFCCGPLMRSLWEALPSDRQGAYAETSSLLESHVLSAIRPGDAVMVKGSLGSRMAIVVKALQGRYCGETAPAQG